MNIENYTVNQATHNLSCRHCICNHSNFYMMKCLPVATTKSGKVKIVVFGDRDWAGRDDHKRVRYVDGSRLKTIEDEK